VAFVDIYRVMIVGIADPGVKINYGDVPKAGRINKHIHFYPSNDAKTRWVVPEHPPADWPFLRTLYVVFGGKAWRADGKGFGNIMLAPGAPGAKALQDGPLFQGSYFKPAQSYRTYSF
jgi:hypothetical protein